MVMSIGWFARIGADFMWRVGGSLPGGLPIAFRVYSTAHGSGGWSCALQAGRAVWSRSGPWTPFSSMGPISVNLTGPASAASTTSWLQACSCWPW
jgi:hypothetical protein